MPFAPTPTMPNAALDAGFRHGDKGTHTSRTMMSAELADLLRSLGQQPTRAEILDAVVVDNVLGKSTTATRKLSLQRLSELYALDPAVALYRVLVRLWRLETGDHALLLALLCALARDPLLRASAEAVIRTPTGAPFPRAAVAQALREATRGRLGDAVLDKVVRNIASSWSQAGHYSGRTFKVRQAVAATPATCAFALYLATLAGYSAQDSFASAWCEVLDLGVADARALALDAKRLGLLDVRMAGDVVELNILGLDPLEALR